MRISDWYDALWVVIILTAFFYFAAHIGRAFQLNLEKYIPLGGC